MNIIINGDINVDDLYNELRKGHTSLDLNQIQEALKELDQRKILKYPTHVAQPSYPIREMYEEDYYDYKYAELIIKL